MSDHVLISGPEAVVENPIGLDKDRVIPVIKFLNADLATTYTFYHQIKKHHWLVEGPEYWQLHTFLDTWAASLLKTADAIAERITALGGYPVSGPAAQEQLSIISMEAEGTFGLRGMLEKDLADGEAIAIAVRGHVRQAAEAGDYGSEHMLKEILLEHEQMVHHLEHFLGKMSLALDLLK